MFKYVVVAKKNPMDQSVKFYAAPDKTTPITIDTITQRIEKRTTVSSADAKAVLDALEYEIKEALIEGHSVRLGDLGTFRATIQGEGALNRADHTAKLISHLKCCFKPSVRLANWLNPTKNPELRFMKSGDVYSHLGPVEEE